MSTQKNIKKFSIMIGPCLNGAGGISSVLNQYNSNGFFTELNALFWPSWEPGSTIKKMASTLYTAFKLLFWIVTGRVNLIHLHSATKISFLRKSIFAFIGITCGVPVIFHIHAGKFFQDYRIRSLLYKKWVEFILKRSTAVVVLSQTWRDEASTLLKKGDTIHIVPNPIDLSLPATFKRVPRHPDKLRLLFLGGLTEAKGFFDLIAAIPQLRAKGLNIELRCGGNGDIEKIHTLLAKHQLSDSIILLGWIDERRKLQEFESADAFILPSHFEGQPMSILEAMQAGVPVIATRVGGIPDIITHNQTGLLAELGNASDLEAQIERLYNGEVNADNIVSKGQQYVSRMHSPHTVLATLKLLYSKVLENCPPKTG